MKLAETVTFGGSGLNRAAELRADADKLMDLWTQSDTRVVPLWRGKPLFGPDGAGWVPAEAGVLTHGGEKRVFLGLDEGGPRFAMDVSSWEPESMPETLGAFFDPSEQVYPDLPDDWRFAELRGRMAQLSPRDAECLAMGRGIFEWHRTHKFCARCGQPSQISMGGWQRDCPSCGGHHFPRTDPVVIMLITFGNSVLLGRSPGWPEGMYSCLAGFVEPGETIEAAARREVFEESGVRVGRVDYLSSQPWPFPNSLMFGVHGHADSNEITIDPLEIEDAIWLTREEAMTAIAGDHPTVKPARKGSIAHFLIVNWLADRLD